ncbi:hypothetical protein N7510_009402 [Penicillium lagena]|uniref:uncharacterized protein n=1 Tax=Penicillium lagena TaxID=94218 RepID=UPI00254185CF|nr:uncharacterized protein N7510_009402 [Penicillium lagena]KAJ5606621.1 hypothetical protein N7510_009402 [Penicillium lagena]
MKSFSPVALALFAVVGMVTAADMSTSDCANMCISNMNAKASELGCSSGDMTCLCKSQDYEWGVRDCTDQACPGSSPQEAVQMALSKCPGGSGSGSGSGSVSSSGAAGGATTSIMTGTTTLTGANGQPTATLTNTETETKTGNEHLGSSSTSTGAAMPMATVGSGAAVLGLAAMLVL